MFARATRRGHDWGLLDPSSAAREKRLGLVAGTAAYGLWGLFPAYFKALSSVAPLEVLAHRITWAAAVLVCLVRWQERGGELVRTLTSRRCLSVLVLSSAAIAFNWLVYITAVVNGHVVEASLGYFITPLVSVLLGVVVLRERLARPVLLAVGLAIVGVLWITAHAGRLPVISLLLAFSFGSYGLLRKLVPVRAVVGVAVETMLLLPLSSGYLVWSHANGALAFRSGGWTRDALLLLSGPLTAGPLLLFGAALRRLPLSTLGFIQYLSPTLQLLLGVLVYGEAFSAVHGVAFGFIWSGLGVFAAHSMRANATSA